MISTTIAHGPLRLDWDGHGTLTIVRTDTAQSVQLSVSEMAFILKAADLAGWPIYPPVPEQIGPT